MDPDVEVYIRLRPETEGIWDLSDKNLSYVSNSTRISYPCFENVYQLENNQDIYRNKFKDCIEKFINNQNVTIFAYGQTGSGKTHTMFGSDNTKGLVQLSLADIFESSPAIINLSFIELFNEKIFDLYTKKELKMFTSSKEVIIKDLHIQETRTLGEALDFVNTCQQNRKNGITEFNYHSSRSHGILCISKNDKTLYFIDLAGSERATKDKNRLIEGGYINKSLLALGKLVNNSLEGRVMLFRESKLTRILQSSFENKTNIIAICTISSLYNSVQESISTLNFASRISNLKLKALETKILPKGIQSNNYIDELLEKHRREIELYQDRIINLENLVISLLEKNPNKTTSEIYILEKQMFKLSLESQNES